MTNILQHFYNQGKRQANNPCWTLHRNGAWHTLSWSEVLKTVQKLHHALKKIGVRNGTKIGILSSTCYQWSIADLAILALKGISVPLHSTLAGKQVIEIIKDSNCEYLFVEDMEQWLKIKSLLDETNIKEVIAFHKFKDLHLDIDTLIDGINEIDDTAYLSEISSISLEDNASYIYTSGTTGEPKGVVITHKSIMAEVEGLQDIFDLKENELIFLFLPLSHVIGRSVQFYHLAQGCQLSFVQSMQRIPENMREVRPHFVSAVPRFFEKFYENIVLEVCKRSFITKKLFYKCVSIGEKMSDHLRLRKKIPFRLRIEFFIAKSILLRKLYDALGGRIQYFICGGAPLSKDLARFFHALGILICEGWGLTETFSAATLNRPDDYHFGTVGKPLKGVQLRLEADNEIFVRGDVLFKEYYKKPEATQNVLDKDGWFATGDIGEFSKDGFLRITGRKKDIIITAGGKNIAPQQVEGLIQKSKYIDQVVVHGDRRKYLSALITLNFAEVEEYARNTGISWQNRDDLANHKDINNLIKSEIDSANSNLAGHETVKRFAILENHLSIETGEMTPTMKIKRQVVENKYKDILDALYK
ncbi:long-chain fatty acid--CoA ligase [bacterium]|nr:long-chain fatty acid--CoA ligase [bacterium]